MQCITPYSVKDKKTGQTFPVPCGKCPPCKKRRASGWSFRLMQEEKRSTSAYFITLTYDTACVPITSKGFMSLRKRDPQLFFKRLRKRDPTSRIRYYAVGEYGGRTNRPHYHLILFNAKLELIQPAWNMGQVHYGEVTGASIGYCLKYMMKEGKIPMHANDDRTPEFQLCSKGLGENYLTENIKKWHYGDITSRCYCSLPDGTKVCMPRYYRDKLYVEEAQKKKIQYAAQKSAEEALQHNEKIMSQKFGCRASEILVAQHAAQFKKMYKDALRGRDKL